MLAFLRKTLLWIALLPYALGFTGAALNQAVLIANHDTFPVMTNQRVTNHDGFKPDKYGIIDDEGHSVMTPKTHLNFLADIFDLKVGYFSVGDFLLMLGGASETPCLFLWGVLVCARLNKKE